MKAKVKIIRIERSKEQDFTIFYSSPDMGVAFYYKDDQMLPYFKKLAEEGGFLRGTYAESVAKATDLEVFDYSGSE